MICKEDLIGLAFNFLQTKYEIILVDAPRSNKQLWIFQLKIVKVGKNGGVFSLDCLLNVDFKGMVFLVEGEYLKEFNNNSWFLLIFKRPSKEMLAHILFISSTMLYIVLEEEEG
jgi:hypothetical protein